MTSSTPLPADIIIISDLRAQATVGPDRWGKVSPQPIRLSAFIEASLVAAAKSDDVIDTIHYGNLAKEIAKLINNANFDSLYALAQSVASLLIAIDQRVMAVNVAVDAGNQFLRAQSLGVQIRETRQRDKLVPDRTLVKELAVSTIIGVNPAEREAKQTVLVDLTFYSFDWCKADWNKTHAILVEAIEASSYLTLEAFATRIAYVASNLDGADTVTVQAQKPSAIRVARASGVQVTRNRACLG